MTAEPNRRQIAVGWKDGKPILAKAVKDQTAGQRVISDAMDAGRISWGAIYAPHTFVAKKEKTG